MNFGKIVRLGLQRSELPTNDYEHLNLARDYANDAISELWYLARADYRQSSSVITTVNGSDTYILNKLFDSFVPNSLRGGAATPRIFQYKDPEEFFRITRNFQNTKGVPYLYTFGEFIGIDAQLQFGSQIKVFSSLASKTLGTVKVVNGSRRVTGSMNNQFSINDVGQRIQLDGDSISYRVAVFVDHRNIDLEDIYRGNSQDSALYKLGDVGVHANIQGYVGGQLDSEDVYLDGSNVVTTAKLFTTLTSCSKSELTAGKVTFQDSNGNTVSTLAPGETAVERQSIVMWRIPSATETLNYRFYMKHPVLRLDTDRPLIPEKYHPLIVDLTTARLREWAEMNIGDYLVKRIQEGKDLIVNDANDCGLWTVIPQEEGSGITYGQPDAYNKIVDPDFIV